MISQEWLDRCPCCSKVWVCWCCEGADHQVWVRQECSGSMHVHMLQGGLNGLLIAAIGNHEEVVRTLVGEFGLSVNHRDNVSYTSAVSQLQCRSLYDIHCSLNGSDRDCSLCTSSIECKSDEEYAWPHCVHVGISIQKSLSNLLYIRTYVLALCSPHLLIPSPLLLYYDSYSCAEWLI